MTTNGNKFPPFEFTKESTDFFQKIKSLRFFEDFDKLSLKPNGFHGEFNPNRIYEMFEFCKKNPQYHVLSKVKSIYYNCYMPNAGLYFLAKGDQNPRLAYDFGPITIADILRVVEFYKR